MAFNQCCHVKYCMQMSANSNYSAVFQCTLISEASAEVGNRVAGGIGKTAKCHRLNQLNLYDVPHLQHCCANHVIMKSTLEQLRCGISQQLFIGS